MYCVCVCVCVCTGFVVYEATNLSHDMGMTEVLQYEVFYEDTAYVPVIPKGLKNILNGVFFENLKMHTVSCEG